VPVRWWFLGGGDAVGVVIPWLGSSGNGG